MSTPRIVSFRIDSEKVAELDTLAKSMDRDRTYLLNEAVESYLSEQRRFVAAVEEGLDDMRKGNYLTHEQVERMAEGWAREAEAKTEQSAQ